MSRFELTPIPEHEFPTLGRSYADRIIDNMLATQGNTFRLTIYRENGEVATPVAHAMMADTLKKRIKERQVDIDVAVQQRQVYLRRSCTPPR